MKKKLSASLAILFVIFAAVAFFYGSCSSDVVIDPIDNPENPVEPLKDFESFEVANLDRSLFYPGDIKTFAITSEPSEGVEYAVVSTSDDGVELTATVAVDKLVLSVNSFVAGKATVSVSASKEGYNPISKSFSVEFKKGQIAELNLYNSKNKLINMNIDPISIGKQETFTIQCDTPNVNYSVKYLGKTDWVCSISGNKVTLTYHGGEEWYYPEIIAKKDGYDDKIYQLAFMTVPSVGSVLLKKGYSIYFCSPEVAEKEKSSATAVVFMFDIDSREGKLLKKDYGSAAWANQFFYKEKNIDKDGLETIAGLWSYSNSSYSGDRLSFTTNSSYYLEGSEWYSGLASTISTKYINEENFPAFYFAEQYLQGINYETYTCYLPSIIELAEIYNVKSQINSVLSKIGATQLNTVVWSSSQSQIHPNPNYNALTIDFSKPGYLALSHALKTESKRVYPVAKFRY